MVLFARKSLAWSLPSMLLLLTFALKEHTSLYGQSPSETIHLVLQTHCIACHDAGNKTNGLDLSTLRWDDPSQLQKLVRIYDRVLEGEMPPRTEPAIPDHSKKSFLDHSSRLIHQIDLDRIQRDGRAMMRRLNRYEYENYLKDLLHLPWLQIRDMLPRMASCIASINRGRPWMSRTSIFLDT